MRINALRITNLASLRGEQPAIELRGPVLGAAGLIAVTGPTGAGKTTLFDAVCLALFDETPRTRGRGRDPRDLLARGAASAQVELEIELDDGSAWRAEWSVHRARDRADGLLQASRQRIVDLATGTVLAEGKKQVQALVDKSLGLSFDQFTSVVLIAQGQFAKFLEATDTERSALLERLTGTEIYSELSRAAFERARAAQEKVQELEAVARHFAGLGEEQRRELEEQLAAADAELAAQNDRVAALEAAARRLAELEGRLLRAAEARQGLAAAEAALAGSAADQERRRRALRAALAVPALERRDAARQAAVLAAAEQAGCAAAAGEAGQALAAARQELAVRWGELRGSRAAAARALEGLRGAEALAGETMEDLRGLWRRRQRTRETLAERGQEAGQAQAELDACQRENFDVAGELHLARERIRPLGARLSELAAELAALGAGRTREEWARRRVDLQQAEGLAAELRGHDLTAIEKEEKQLRRKAAAAEEALAEARGRLAAAQGRRVQQEALLRLASRQADLAEHRPQLRDGEPCPLCGALEHPWDTRAAAEDQGVLKAAEAELAGLLEAERLAGAAASAAADAQHQAQVAVATLLTRRANAEQQIRSARGRWIELRLVLPELPAEPDAFVPAELARIGERLDGFDRLLPLETAARQALLAAEREAATAATRQAVVGERLHAAESRRSEAAAALAAAAEDDGRAEQLFLACAGDLAARAGVAPPGNEKALDFLGRLETHLKAWRAANELGGQLAALEERTRRRHPALDSPAPLAEAGTPAEAASLADLERALEAALGAEAAGEQRLRLWEDRSARAAAEVEERGRQQLGAEQGLAAALAAQELAGEEELRQAILPAGELAALETRLEQLAREKERREERSRLAEQELAEAAAKAAIHLGEDDPQAAREQGDADLAAARQRQAEIGARGVDLRSRLRAESDRRAERQRLEGDLAEARERQDLAARLSALIGQKDGGKFRRFAQRLNLDLLLELANLRLDRLSPRYQLARLGESLDLEVIDREMADERRPVTTLSGGESFLVSLALALALADLRRGSLRLGTLFLDEGFGSLDEDTLDTALSVLEQLQADQNTQILIVSHVGALKERIDHRIDVQKLGGGRSRLTILGG